MESIFEGKTRKIPKKERKKYLYRKNIILESIFYDFVVLESEKFCIDREVGLSVIIHKNVYERSQAWSTEEKGC